MSDRTVIDLLEAALEKDPNQAAVRRHLATLLVEAGEGEAALGHLQTLLVDAPADLDLLQMAARAADLADKNGLGDSYRRLAQAMGGSAPTPPPPATDAPPRGMEDLFTEPSEPQKLIADDRSAAEWDVDTKIPEFSLKDVAGLKEVKERLEISFLGPMRNEDLRKMYKKSLRGGLLLYGPPGCGKTFLAKAIAGELMARFISISITDVLDMYIGQSEKNLHEIFELARRIQPCVIFMDELDALGRKRSLMRSGAGAGMINQLLEEMDGVSGGNEGIFILGATNHPWDVDAALRRPGRFDRTLLVLPPDEPARQKILADQLEDRPMDRIDLGAVVKKTDDFSGADLVHLVDSASEFAMADTIRQGKVRPINQGDFDRALKEVKPSIRTWLETAKNFAIYANEGGSYDDLAAYLRKKRII